MKAALNVFTRRLKRLTPLSWRQSYWRIVASLRIPRSQREAETAVLGTTGARSLRYAEFWPFPIAKIQLPNCEYPFYYRPRTSDPEVIRQVFVRREYDAIQNEPNVRLILDCGANIGCTSFLLLHAYPEAHVVVVEPDAGNMDLCRKNLAPFQDRVTFVQAGIWESNVPLRVVRGEFRDGQPWSFQVRPSTDNEPVDFLGVTIGDLLRNSQFDTIDLLKMDIEGAERTVFSGVDLDWLDTTRVLAVELHDRDCRLALEDALSKISHTSTRSGELTICQLAPSARPTSHVS